MMRRVLLGKMLASLTGLLMGCATTSPQQLSPSTATSLAGIVELLAQGDLAVAHARLMALPESSKNSALWHQTWAYYYELSEQSVQADQAYQAAIKCTQGAPAVENNYASFLCRQGQYEQAMIVYQQAVNHSATGQQGIILENAGWCALEQGDKNMALSYFKQAQQILPHSADWLDNIQTLTE